MKIPFWKTEAVSNDFVLIHQPKEGTLDLPNFAITVCDRNFGIGSDGLLVISSDLKLRMFNPDGSEDFCGNGLRCAADHAVSMGWAKDSFVIEHFGADVACSIDSNQVVSVTLEPARLDPESVPVNPSLYPSGIWIQEICGVVGSAVSTGSTHFVIPVDELPEDAEFFELGPKIEHHPAFPERTSAIWARNRDGEISLRIWERGAGETLGCGTGSVAAAFVLSKLTASFGSWKVKSKGGEVTVRIADEAASPILSSAVHRVFSGTVSVKPVPAAV